MGAMKAGVQIVTFTEREDEKALGETLKASGAKGLIFSPDTHFTEDGERRIDAFKRLFPELENSHAGDKLDLSAYPKLKVIS